MFFFRNVAQYAEKVILIIQTHYIFVRARVRNKPRAFLHFSYRKTAFIKCCFPCFKRSSFYEMFCELPLNLYFGGSSLLGIVIFHGEYVDLYHIIMHRINKSML